MAQNNVSVDANLYSLSNVQIGANQEEFRIVLFSGNQIRQFMTTPAHAKRIHLLLKQGIANYEDEHGEIDTSLPKGDEEGTSPDSEAGLGFSK